jgi:hypothetical protein
MYFIHASIQSAKAQFIQESFTGTITNSSGPQGAFGAFGGVGVGHAVALSFSYNPGFMIFGTDNATFVGYSDDTGDGAVTESITINSRTLTVSDTGPSNVEGLINHSAFFQGSYFSIDVAELEQTYVLQPVLYFFSDLPYSPGLVQSQTGVNEFMQNISPFQVGEDAEIELDDFGFNGGILDIGDVQLTTPQSTPEAPVSIPLALAVGIIALMKRRSKFVRRTAA